MVGGAARDRLAGLPSCSDAPMGKTGRSGGLWPVTSHSPLHPTLLSTSVALGRRITPDVQPHSLAPHADGGGSSALAQHCPVASPPDNNTTMRPPPCVAAYVTLLQRVSEQGASGAIFDPRLCFHRGRLDAAGSWIICISCTISLNCRCVCCALKRGGIEQQD